jgi:hypothetical protein
MQFISCGYRPVTGLLSQQLRWWFYAQQAGIIQSDCDHVRN